MQLKGQRIGQYRILNLLKKGGMGEVYLAKDERLQRRVAIKIIWTDASHYEDVDKAGEAVRLFLREAQTLARFDHPHILPIFDAGEGEIFGLSHMYLVMPYRHKGSLADWLSAHNQRLSIWDIDYLLQQATDALQYAHDLNIVHQDVKASNFLLQGNTQFASQLKLQLADFGIAKFMTTTSKSQVIRGTILYMAPEQWENHPVAATDQYALAIMIFELLTGRPPFVGDNKEQLWHQHCHVQPPRPSSLNLRIPRNLDAVMFNAVAKRPEDRFATVTAFAEAFRQAVLNTNHAPPPVQTNLAHDRIAEPTSFSNLPPIARTVPVIPPPAIPLPDYVPIPPRRHRGKALILFSSVLLLLAGCGGLLYLTWASQQGFLLGLTTTTIVHTAITGTNTTTSTTLRTDTTNTNATSTAQMGATLTANANATQIFYATQTAQIDATNTQIANLNATLTAVAQANLTAYPSVIVGRLLLNDTLQTSTTSGNWESSSYPDGSGCTFTGKAYHSIVPQKGSILPCFAQNTDFHNFAYQIQMTIVHGDQGGIAFRASEANGTYYYFHMNASGAFALDVYSNDIFMGSIKAGSDPAVQSSADQAILLTVVAMDTTIIFLVNKQPVINITDAHFDHGEIGVVAQSTGDSTDIAFTNAEVWQK